MKLGHRDKALDAWRAALPLREQVAKIRPDDPTALAELAKVRKTIAELLALLARRPRTDVKSYLRPAP